MCDLEAVNPPSYLPSIVLAEITQIHSVVFTMKGHVYPRSALSVISDLAQKIISANHYHMCFTILLFNCLLLFCYYYFCTYILARILLIMSMQISAISFLKVVGVRMTQRQNDTVRHFGTVRHYGTEGHFGTATKWHGASLWHSEQTKFFFLTLIFNPNPNPCKFDHRAKVTYRARVTHRVILSLCQSDAPCHFVAVSFWPAPIIRPWAFGRLRMGYIMLFTSTCRSHKL